MEIARIDGHNRKDIDDFIREHWFTTEMVIDGRIVDMTKAEGFYALEDGKIVGLITFLIQDGGCEITSLDSLLENRGVGTELVNRVIGEAKERGCGQVTVVTTNDNTRAIRFYQKRGFDMAQFRRGALERSRELKPAIPLLGNDGIPLRHEIEFQLSLDNE